MVKDEPNEREEVSKQTHATIDRLEDGHMAVLYVGEDEKTQVDIPASLLPGGASDGDHLRITITLDRASRDDAKARITKLREQLKEHGEAEDKKDFKL